MSQSTALLALDGIVSDAERVGWTDARLARRDLGGIVERIVSAPELLADVVGDVLDRRGAAGGCESYPNMDKLVLWSSRDGDLRLRLHLFFPGYADRPHNHRWSFLSRILAGGYLHSLYGTAEDALSRVEQGLPLRVLYAREETAGSTYFLDHTLVHSLRADTVTASLLLRGPAFEDTYFTLLAGPPGTQPAVDVSAGAARESPAELSAKAMTDEGFERVRTTLRRLGLLP
jgi:hypothetical protein